MAGAMNRIVAAAFAASTSVSRLVALCVLGSAIFGGAQGQPNNALILPPRIADSPTAARLSEPPPERTPALEEVIVVGESEWRLPDLGSDWRRAQEDAPTSDRIVFSFLPLYEPENSDPVVDIYTRNSELHRLKLIEVLRFRFGRRPAD
jgi:hypothetical protein